MLEKQRLTYLECFGIDNYVPRRTLLGAAPSPLLPDELLQDPAAFSTADLKAGDALAHSPGVDLGVDVNGHVVSHRHDTDTSNSQVGSQGSPQSLQSISEMLSSGSSDIDSPDTASPDTDKPHPTIVATEHLTAENPENKPADNSIHHTADVTSVETTINSPVLEPSALKSSDLKSSAPSNERSTNTAPTSDAPSAESSTAVLRFTLNVWRVNDLLIVDSRQPASALPTDRLLQNILRSIGYRIAQLPASELLRWPLFTSPQFANTSPEHDEAEARAMVHAYISAQCLREPTQAVLLLGQEACAFGLTPDQPRELFFAKHQGSSMVNDIWKLNTIVAPSLVDMLQEPSKKRLTWQALQSLMASDHQP